MNVLSLFDGISCARVALDRIGVEVEVYYAAEIDDYAIKISQKNYPFPKVIPIGEVEHVSAFYCGHIDLLVGGSPCQDLSIAKKNRQGLDGKKSGLFWEYVRILKEVQPKRFLLENVASMSKESKDIITKALGVEPIMINAALVSAQNRKRLFRTNIPGVTQPEDRGITLKDIIEDEVDEKYYVNLSEKYGLKGLCELEGKAKTITASCHKGYGNDGVSIIQRSRGFNKGGIFVDKSPTLSCNSWEQNNHLTIRVGQIGNGGQGERIYSTDGKSVALSANGGGRGAKTGLYDIDTIVRKLTPIECERLQGLPDNYTEGASNTQRYKMLGNAFNVDVIAHILSFIPRG